jgi:sortase (surface protein transpeptidase)
VEDKVEIIESLVKLIKSEINYAKWYKEEEARLKLLNENEKYQLYNFYSRYRVPNKTTITESLNMIGRLGFQASKEVDIQ